jgi:hypothetical protein
MAGDHDWRAVLQAAPAVSTVEADAYVTVIADSFARPHLYRGTDLHEYAVKLPRPAELRSLLSDHFVARLAAVVGAPVPRAVLLEVPVDMLPADEPIEAAGIAHALPFVGPVTDDGVQHVEGNEARFGALAVLYTWLGTGGTSQYQLSYRRSPGEAPVVFSFDHGAFLQPANLWNATSLSFAPAPTAIDAWCMRSGIDAEHLRPSAMRLEDCTLSDVAAAAATLPASWGVTLDEREALCRFAWGRRSATLELVQGVLG